MVHWPPCACVEDEATSLEHEQIPPRMVEALKSDDDPAVSRGTIDQYPILVDTNDSENTEQSTFKSGTKNVKSTGAGSSDDSTGPTTPPPLSRRRTVHDADNKAQSGQTEQSGCRSESCRGRPQVARIDTTLGADLQAMATGNRRAPSPYSYSRSAAKTTGSVEPSSTLLSPSNMRKSPIQDPGSSTVHFSPNSSADARAVLSDVPDYTGRERRRHRSKSRARSRSHPREPSVRRERRSSRRNFDDSSSDDGRRSRHRSKAEVGNVKPAVPARRYQTERESFTPPYSRRQSKETYYASGGEEGSTRASRYTPGDRHSAEEPANSSLPRSDQRCPSPQRRERPQLDTFPDHIRSRRPTKSSVDDSVLTNKESSRRSHLNPPTPLTADAAKSMEDYFERAFRDNESRQSTFKRGYQGSDSAVASPLTSPPRTPKSERQSRDYLEADASSQRPVQRSRPPSVDEGQLAALKAHTTLLSAATAGAAIAARGSSDQSYSSRTGSTPRSRRPSPVLEEQHNSSVRSNAAVQADILRPVQATPYVAEPRPGSRSSLHDVEPTHPFSPQRSASYSGHEKLKGILKPTSSPAFDSSHAFPASSLNYSPTPNKRPTMPTSQPADTFVQHESGLRLPSCPRSKPVAGYKDWTTIKEMSDLDICPTCANALRTTRFNHLLVPSLPRPYHEPSVCAMSKPWLRIAFLRAYRQGRVDLAYLRALSSLPSGTKPCNGNKLDQRIWFDIVDPFTLEPIPNFVACSACVRAVDIIFPELQHLLDRPKGATNQAKVCSLHTESKHFSTFIDQFEQAATRCRGRRWRSADVQPLINTIRKACRYQECCRDKLLSTRAWHFMPELPEFTICEECYDDVVWPLSDKGIARDISKTTKIVPKRRNSMGNSGISCQLYSERMRKLFRDVVAARNFAPLRDAARTRQTTQLRLHEMNKLYEADQKYGIDRRTEIGKNNAIWHSLE